MNVHAVEAIEDAEPELAKEAESRVTDLFAQQDTERYRFHTFDFVSDFVEYATEICTSEVHDEQLRERIVIAAWFAYSGFAEGHPAIAEKSAVHAREFLRARAYDFEKTQEIVALVESVHQPGAPTNLAQEVLRDASIAYTARRKFKKRSKLLRAELEGVGNGHFNDQEWKNYLIGVLTSSRFYTAYAVSEWMERQLENLRSISSELKDTTVEDLADRRGKNIEKAVDTLFRTQMRYLLSMVIMADRKAQMIIGVNSISLSILLSTMEELIGGHSYYAIPVVIFLTVNLAAMILAVLAIAPRTPKTHAVSREDVLLRQGSLMSQVMFCDIDFDNFKVGMKQMMSDENYLYDTLLRNMYENGRVLQRKYRMLRAAYWIFICGIPVSSVAFIVVFALKARH